VKILSVIGARPQFVKLAPLSRELRRRHTEVILHTGQHHDPLMSDRFFEELEIPLPDRRLGIHGGSHGEQTGRMLAGIESAIREELPDGVIVFGDTNSTLAGALAAAKMHVPVLHVEAGLRSFNRRMPEEVNRVLTDHASDLLFAPTPVAMANLEREGLAERAHLVGDIMVDSLEERARLADARSRVLETLDLAPASFYLLTLHRPSNVDDPARLAAVLEKIGELERSVVFPVHPRTRAVIESASLRIPESILLTEPLGSLDFVRLAATAAAILTDSGGVQKEAYILGTPCITLRTETEWVETVEAGWNVLADPGAPGFVDTVTSFRPTGNRRDLYGRDVARTMVTTMESALADRA
jgi:UDP-GlcNAc3NAcA epimerase